MDEITVESLAAEMEISAGDSSGKLQGVIARLLEKFRALLQKHGCEYADKLLAAAKIAYENACKVIDIPYVPELIEMRIESAIWYHVIDPTLRRIVANVCGVASPPIELA